MELPDLKYNYSHANVESVTIGPRREVTLLVSLLEWVEQYGQSSPAKALRFGGIANFEAVKEFFAEHQTFQLANLRYSTEHNSKPSNLFVELNQENNGEKIVIQCSSIQVG